MEKVAKQKRTTCAVTGAVSAYLSRQSTDCPRSCRRLNNKINSAEKMLLLNVTYEYRDRVEHQHMGQSFGKDHTTLYSVLLFTVRPSMHLSSQHGFTNYGRREGIRGEAKKIACS